MFVEDFKCFCRTPDMECSMWSLLEEGTELDRLWHPFYSLPHLCCSILRCALGYMSGTFHSKSWCMTYALQLKPSGHWDVDHD